MQAGFHVDFKKVIEIECETWASLKVEGHWGLYLD